MYKRVAGFGGQYLVVFVPTDGELTLVAVCETQTVANQIVSALNDTL